MKQLPGAILAFIALLGAAKLASVYQDAEVRSVESKHPALVFAPDDRSRCGEAYGVLTVETLQGSARRRGYFTEDRGIPAAWRPGKDDYRGWDTGHCAAAAWYGDQQLQDLTFTYSNAMPEDRALNRGLGAQIEALIREEIVPGVKVHFAVTPLWLLSDDVVVQTTGAHEVWVPTDKAWSILIERDGAPVLARCWIVPNKPPPKGAKPEQYRTTVDQHEFYRGRDFFAWLPDDIEDKLESAK